MLSFADGPMGINTAVERASRSIFSRGLGSCAFSGSNATTFTQVGDSVLDHDDIRFASSKESDDSEATSMTESPGGSTSLTTYLFTAGQFVVYESSPDDEAIGRELSLLA